MAAEVMGGEAAGKQIRHVRRRAVLRGPDPQSGDFWVIDHTPVIGRGRVQSQVQFHRWRFASFRLVRYGHQPLSPLVSNTGKGGWQIAHKPHGGAVINGCHYWFGKGAISDDKGRWRAVQSDAQPRVASAGGGDAAVANLSRRRRKGSPAMVAAQQGDNGFAIAGNGNDRRVALFACQNRGEGAD